ncbi:unnamed protein product [Phaedon cochleariae]|uniref:Complex I assembly factor TIMMDC1, mitochondrial n=1 Tax=Phaedon cochleariae TaxID=80249 RepID=A0A9P0GV73_PHACE|nr:unnamed protein product [Phaedon cochleariae]
MNSRVINNVGKTGIKYSFIPFASLFGVDKLENLTETELKADKTVEESGSDRLKRMFSVDEFGSISKEVSSILQVAAMSTFIGGMYGGIINSRTAYLEFMKNNEATKFTTHLEAKQKLQDKVTISFGKGAFKWGWRLTLFCTSFVGIATTVQVYKGKCGIMEYVAAGGLTGALYKFNMGPRGWIVGGGLGSLLGLICGGTTVGLLKLGGISMEDARYWQYQWKDHRNEYFRKGMEEYLEKEDFAVIKLHDDKVGEAGKDIKNLNLNDRKHVESEK